MARRDIDDFERGYMYAKDRLGPLLESMSCEEILHMASELFQVEGSTAELARGIGQYYREFIKD